MPPTFVPDHGYGAEDVRTRRGSAGRDGRTGRATERSCRRGGCRASSNTDAWPAWLAGHRAPLLALVAALAIAVGGLLHVAGEGDAGRQLWRVTVALLAAELAFEIAHTVLAERHVGVDTIALA